VRMRARGIESFDDYAHLLDRDAAELDRLVGSLTVSVTRFFRNLPVWDVIAGDVVPELWQSERADIRVWSAGCASGEEAYSLAMLFHRHAATQGMLAQIGRVQVLGTDVDRAALAAADRATYSEQDVTDTSDELRSRYFTPAPYTPVPGIRRLVRFAQHDLLGADYPPARQDLIVCRNVLIYFDRPSQERVIERLTDSLIPGGYLILGKVETLLGAPRAQFLPVAPRERIFRKVS
jgi:chemotaxis methyl-accepting protein methylase